MATEEGEPVKILFVTNARLCSGAEEHLIDLAHWLEGAEVSFSFAVRQKSVFAARLEHEKLPYTPCFAEKGGALGSIRRLIAVMVREQPDIISVNREHNIYPTWVAALCARPFMRQRPKLVMVFHTPTGRKYPILSRFDGILATSRFTATAFVRANPHLQEKMAVIHYGTQLPPSPDAEKVNPARQRRFLRQQGFPLIGMVGELWKNQEELIPIAKCLVGKFPGLTVAIVGGEGEASFSQLRALIEDAGLERNFLLVPRVPRALIPDLFYDLDLSVSTHRNEGFGIVHIESLAAGTPVVAYHAGGLVEILERGGSALVDGGVEDFSQAVSTLLDDHTERQRLAEEGRTVVEAGFSLEVMGGKHLAYYRALSGGERHA